MRWHDYTPLTEAPEFRALSRSRQEVLRFLWRRADDDGVVRRLICVRKIAEKLDMPKITVRKALQYLDQHGIITRRIGGGRDRSVYVVPVAWDRPLTDPAAEPPPRSSRRAAATADTAPAGTPRDDALFPAARAAGSTDRSTNGRPPAPNWLPRRPPTHAPAAGTSGYSTPPTTAAPAPPNGHGATAASRVPAPRAGEPDDKALWCERAIEEGARHRNSRCCHSTARQLAAQQKAAAAARARETEQQAAAARRQAPDLDAIDRGVALARAAIGKPRQDPP